MYDPEAADEPSESVDGPPQPPGQGKSLWVGGLEIVNNGPMRPGLPDHYAVRQRGLLVSHGSFARCLEQAEKLFGGPLPVGKATASGMDEATPWTAQSDQLPPPKPLPVVHHHRPEQRGQLEAEEHS